MGSDGAVANAATFDEGVRRLEAAVAGRTFATRLGLIVAVCEAADRLRVAGWQEQDIAIALTDVIRQRGQAVTVATVRRHRISLARPDLFGMPWATRCTRLWGVSKRELARVRGEGAREAAARLAQVSPCAPEDVEVSEVEDLIDYRRAANRRLGPIHNHGGPSGRRSPSSAASVPAATPPAVKASAPAKPGGVSTTGTRSPQAILRDVDTSVDTSRFSAAKR